MMQVWRGLDCILECKRVVFSLKKNNSREGAKHRSSSEPHTLRFGIGSIAFAKNTTILHATFVYVQ